MATATIPLTKDAQKLKPHTGPVPSYVLALEKHALNAGLTTERRQTSASGHLHLFWSGTRSQISSLRLLHRPERIRWPTGKCPSWTTVAAVPLGDSHVARIYRVSTERYVLAMKLDLSISNHLDNDVKRFACRIGANKEHQRLENEMSPDRETPQEWKVAFVRLAEASTSALLEGLSDDGEMCIASEDRQRIVRAGEQLQAAIMAARVIVATRATRPVLQLVKGGLSDIPHHMPDKSRKTAEASDGIGQFVMRSTTRALSERIV